VHCLELFWGSKCIGHHVFSKLTESEVKQYVKVRQLNLRRATDTIKCCWSLEYSLTSRSNETITSENKMKLISIQSTLNQPSVSQESLYPTPNPPSLICRAQTPPDTLPPLRYGYWRSFSNKAELAASRQHVRDHNTPLPTLPIETLVRINEDSVRVIPCPEVPAITRVTRAVCQQDWTLNSAVRGRRLCAMTQPGPAHICKYTRACTHPSIHKSVQTNPIIQPFSPPMFIQAKK